jgi:heme exporter protein B
MNPNNTQTWLKGSLAIFEKDVRLELRSRYAINMLLMFVASSLALVMFAVGSEAISQKVQSALVWLVVVFSSVIGVGRSFVSEEEQGTVLLLHLHTRGSMVYAGKLLFNFILLLLLNIVAFVGFVILLNVDYGTLGYLALFLLLGALGLSGTTTLLAAMIARSANKGPLLAVLAFPLLIPLLLSVVSATKSIFLEAGWTAIEDEFVTLVAFSGTVITASVLLFDYVWND